MATLNERFLSTLKQTEISNWLELYLMRRLGYILSIGLNKIGVHPNTVTIVSMILGAGSAYFFASGSYYYEGLEGLLYNIIAIGMLFWADVLDNTDGQLARLSGKRSRIGRILDGMSGFVWFVPIYLALAWRIYQHHDIEFAFLGLENNETNSIVFSLAVLVLVFYSGFACNGGQQRMSDYYVNVHLYFMKAANGNELDTSDDQKRQLEMMQTNAKWWERMFMKSYVDYTLKQERATPKLQAYFAKIKSVYGSLDNLPDDKREIMRQRSLKLMQFNVLGFMERAFILTFCVLIDMPLLHFLIETIVLGYATHRFIQCHETMCEKGMSEL